MAEKPFSSYREALHAANVALRAAHALLPVAQLDALTAHELAMVDDLTRDLRNEYIGKQSASGYMPTQIGKVVGLSASRVCQIVTNLKK